ncbi:MAG: YceI family protein [Nanoarchaeota archaeon]|nr:YceI family protein [Nanoarchaeota archaeon]
MMIKAFAKRALLILLLLGLASPAFAAATLWKVDPPHCAITFKIDHIWVKVPGAFREFNGEIRFDPKALAASSLDIQIKVASVDTGVKQRDNHLLSADFFDVAKHPLMTFKSKSIVSLGKGLYLAKGELAIKGQAKPVDLKFKFFGAKDAPMRKGVKVAGFEAFHKLDRLAYGVGDGKFARMGVVGKMVDVEIYLELTSK